MRRFLSVMLVVIVVGCSFANGQTSTANSTKKGDPDEEAIKQLERDWDIADTKGDTAALDRILASDYVQINLNGASETKAQRLNSLKSKERTFESKTINEMRIQLLGNVAVVYGLSTVKSTLQGKDTSGQYRWTDVLVKRNGQWQALTTQSTKVTK